VKGDHVELYDGVIRVVDDKGEKVEEFAPSTYVDHIEERTDPRSYTKAVYLKKRGAEGGSYRVAPLGRINVAKSFSTPLADTELQELKALVGGGPVQPILFYHCAHD
jgi:coenzyme F420-reducing hydrogenase alpha subunit